jgi:SAM-dependent methyltransferase
MHEKIYLMEDELEIDRLERKTDIRIVQEQARWAGLMPGMRVADIGCGSGKTSHALFHAVQPRGEVVGVDMSEERLRFAARKYGAEGLRFVHRNVAEPLEGLGAFDFIWVRFFLEYHRNLAQRMVTNLARVLKPGGILCLIDLDYNCRNHYDMPECLSFALKGVMDKLEQDFDFDSRMGIKLYSFLFDLGFTDIDMRLEAHHLIFGELKQVDAFNWARKVDIAVRRSEYIFDAYPGGFQSFKQDFQRFFSDPRRFTYTPLILCRGRKPAA